MPICQLDCPPDMHHNVEYIRRKDSAMTKYLSTASQLQYNHPILPLLFGLEVVEKDRSLLRLLTPILDDNTRAVDNLACVSLAVQHTCKIISNAGVNFITQNYSHKPAHSPNCFPSGTLIKGILCSEHSATTNFLYASSSHASLRTHMCA
jgi:hypothetical protein